MRVQIERMLTEQHASHGLKSSQSVFGPLLGLAFLSPMLFVCGLMLSQILGFLPY
jgi:hypothetical protein